MLKNGWGISICTYDWGVKLDSPGVGRFLGQWFGSRRLEKSNDWNEPGTPASTLIICGTMDGEVSMDANWVGNVDMGIFQVPFIPLTDFSRFGTSCT